ncbi:MAG: hypothetical protein A2X22_10915 [Bacteroidetes bacterium GWF2_49_14]|nr:MAG: hypothetical protein A2X22_10915 [Bacteroidetes bacterium GWF2_49_14]HBB91417.1 hypothetical protein [Bacteroidales bacterium]
MSPRTEEQYVQIRKNRKVQIMEAALQSFALEGYYKASIAGIAKRAGVSKGLLYNYFDSKEALLDALLAFGMEKFGDILTGIDDVLDTPEELRQYIKGGFELIRREPDFFRLYFGILMQPGVSDLAREHYGEMVQSLIRGLSVYFETKGDANPMEKAMLLGALMDGVGLYYLLAPGTFDLEKLEKMIFELFK